MKKILFLPLALMLCCQLNAQQVNCVLQKPDVTIHFGSGFIPDIYDAPDYQRVARNCPSDGHYTFTASTSDCFGGDWHTISEDHTAGDAGGNMMLVNASYRTGAFLSTEINGLKPGKNYEFGVWMMNICRITEKCPFPLLPSISILLQTTEGKVVAQIPVGDLPRKQSPEWTQYQVMFTTPAAATTLNLLMINNSPGGCGNDFVLDDITFRECIVVPVSAKKTKTPVVAKKQPPIARADPPKKPEPVVTKTVPPVTKPEPPKTKPAPVITKTETPKTTPAPPVTKPEPPKTTAKATPKLAPPVAKKTTPPPKQATTTVPSFEKATPAGSVVKDSQPSMPVRDAPVITQKPPVFAAPPPALTRRSTALVQKILTGPGDIALRLYDNGEIDGDTVSIYHNNVLVVAHARLSEKPISFHITIDPEHPHHELVMVADNLGSIPPNTSLMVVATGTQRYEVYISSSEQKNAKVVFDLKE